MRRTFTLAEPVTVDGHTYAEVTMRGFVGRDLIAFRARAEELRAGADAAQFVLCGISADVPAAVFEEMALADYAAIARFMAPEFAALVALAGGDAEGGGTDAGNARAPAASPARSN